MSRSLWKSPAFFVAVGLLALTAGGLSAVVKTLGLHLTKLRIEPAGNIQLVSIPAKLPGWEQIGKDAQLSVEEAEELGTTNTISRTYVETGVPEGKQPRVLQLHLAYYTGMIDTVPHVPDRCMVAHGAQLAGDKVVVPVTINTADFYPDKEADPAKPVVYKTIPSWASHAVRLPRGVEKLSMTVTPFIDDGRHLFAGYFFIANGGTVASADGVRLLAFKLQDDYAYYLKVQIISYSVDSAEDLGKLSGQFLDVLFPYMMRCVPDWLKNSPKFCCEKRRTENFRAKNYGRIERDETKLFKD